ncbi:hypothetical protein [Pseudonocardia phyllosphaerae]|uniref:hypothetical protein n=1 Tax=Pseudonocardia phyllosphaerae TaxID=3390502 RepID=UPI00397C655B
MTIHANAPRGTASDSLMVQINPDNVLQAHAVFASHAEAILRQLVRASFWRRVDRPGDDPISVDAQRLFQDKIDTILDVHRAHYEEILEVARRLKEAALQYQFTEDEVTAVLKPERERFGLPPLPPPPPNPPRSS